MRARARGRARDRYKDTIFIVAVNPPALPARPEIAGVRGFRKMRRQRSLRARIRNIWTSVSRPPPGSREIGDTVRNVKFTSVTFIVTRTFSRCWVPLAVARARRIVWALFYDRKPSNADRFTRKRLFAPFRRACGRPIRRP